MAIRNFWLEADIDGRKTKLSGGPKSKDGGMQIELFARNNGEIDSVLKINCYMYNGKLTIDLSRKLYSPGEENCYLNEEIYRQKR